MNQTHRPDPVDWGARTLFTLAAFGLLVAIIGYLVEAVTGTGVVPTSQSPLLDGLALLGALLLGFGGLTLWYYRQSLRGPVSEPFPRSLSSPWEGIARFFGVLFLLYLSFLLAAFAVILPQFLDIPVLGDLMAQLEPAALLLGPLGLIGYLTLWYARHPPTATQN